MAKLLSFWISCIRYYTLLIFVDVRQVMPPLLILAKLCTQLRAYSVCCSELSQTQCGLSERV